MRIIQPKIFTRKKMLVSEISTRSLQFALAFREYASLNSNPGQGNGVWTGLLSECVFVGEGI